MRPLRRAAAGILPRGPARAAPGDSGSLGCWRSLEARMTDPIERPADGPRPGRTGMSAEQIQAMSVDVVKPLTGPITLVESDPGWPRLFDREAARIRSILGDRVVRLEHTGSTSVPGLAAKPIIDITMAVADVLDEPAYAADLEAAGDRPRDRGHPPQGDEPPGLQGTHTKR